MRTHKSAWGAPYAPTGIRWGTKVLALFLSLVMCLSMLPAGAFAVDSTTGENAHTHDSSWIPIGGADKNLGAIINKALTTGGLTDAKFYLTDNISYPEDFSQKLPIGSGKTVTLCLNGHTITVGEKEYHREALFTVEEGATLNICDCQGDGVIQGGLN